MNYIIYGEQYPTIKKTLNKLLKDRLGTPDDFNVVKFDYSEEQLDEIIAECSMLPLGYDKKAVVVDNASFLEKANKEVTEKILSCLNNSSDDIDIIFILRNENLDKKGEIVKAINIEGRGEVFELLKLKDTDWPRFAKQFFAKNEVEIDNDAIDELVTRCAGDLTRFVNEANKLCLYKNKITLTDVVLMISKPLENNAFLISDALLKGDTSLALSIYRDLNKVSTKQTEGLIPMLANQFRFFSEIKYLASQGLEYREIANELKANEYRVKISLQNTKRLSLRQLGRILDELYNLDYQTKSGQIDRFYGLELFLINFPN